MSRLTRALEGGSMDAGDLVWALFLAAVVVGAVLALRDLVRRALRWSPAPMEVDRRPRRLDGSVVRRGKWG